MPADHLAEDSQGVFESVHGVEQRFFVLLIVFVVRQRLAFHERDESHEVAHHTACFATRQFGYVGVFLLRHDGTARGETVGNFHEAKVLAHP